MLVAFPAALGLMIATVTMYALLNPHKLGHWINDVPTVAKASASLLVTGIVMVAIIVVFRRRQVLKGFAAAMIVLSMGMSALVAPSLNDTRSRESEDHRTIRSACSR